jgi:formiminotetrahydrofolate cyclodeaminase
MDDCVAIARTLGEETARQLSIPVYFYEAAATRSERIQLENIRRGEFEGLRDEIEKSENRKPDCGPARIHPTAGAIVIGARKLLIAYNINLHTPDIDIARKIAKSIRFSNGGLRFVKAMGVELKSRNLTQVSINLTDFEQTPIHRVFEMVRSEAERYGVSICNSEIVGLIPAKALEMAAEFYLQLDQFTPDLVLENRLNTAIESRKSLCSMDVSQFVDSVSKAETIPGGGSVSALAGALAAALGKMTIGFSLGRKKYETQKDKFERDMASLEKFLPALEFAVDEDSRAYAGVMEALKLPKGSEEETTIRDQKLSDALMGATVVPLEVAANSSSILKLLLSLKNNSNPHLASDLNVGIWLAIAAIKGALENVQTNLSSLPITGSLNEIQSQATEIDKYVNEVLGSLLRH